MNRPRPIITIAVLAAAIAFAAGSRCHAASTLTWTATSESDWSTAANWNTGKAPGSAAVAFVANGGTADITSADTCATLNLGDPSGTSTIEMSAGQLAAAGNEYLGFGGATFNQLAGTNATVPMGSLYVGYNSTGATTYNQLAGTTEIGQALYVGYNSTGGGVYNFSSGNLQFTGAIALANIGDLGAGTLNQTGGVNLALLNGTIQLGLGNAASSGTYLLGGTGSIVSNVEAVGVAGIGLFSQSGGANSPTSFVEIGYSAGASGTYSLSAGTLATYTEFVGYSGSGAISQTGGINTLGNFQTNTGSALILGNSAGSYGVYNLSGSGMLMAYSESIGAGGQGAFNQSGGTNMVSGGTLTAVSGAPVSPEFELGGGSYNFTGGLLVLPTLDGSGSFNLGGGTLMAGGAISSSLPLALTGSGGMGTIEPGGFVVSLSGALTGAGGLDVAGAGELILSGPNTYQGGTVVSGGTLELAGPSAIEDGSALVVGDATAFAAIEPAAAVSASASAASLTAVPEPGTLAMFAAAALVAAFSPRRLRRAIPARRKRRAEKGNVPPTKHSRAN